MFEDSSVNFDLLRQRAFNLRWATVPQGVIPLTAADPDFPCAPEITDAIARFVKDRYFCYGPPEGLPAFKESMAAHFRNKRSIAADAALVLPVDSAAFGIYIACKAFLGVGDEALIFDPVDFLFRYSVEAVGGTAVPFAIPPGTIDIDFHALEALITPRTRMLCLCNPLNPTGKVFTRAELEQFGALATRHNLLILSDEIWSDIIFAPHHYTSIASLGGDVAERTVTITGFSKSYGLAGLRIGAVLAPGEAMFRRLMDASLHSSTVHGANVLSQVAATAALNECGYWLDAFLAHLTAMKSMCAAELNSIPGFHCIPPEGCYVAFTNITGTGLSSQQVADVLMNEAKVSVVPGLPQWFGQGADGYIRMSFATSRGVLEEALDRIKKVIPIVNKV